jgi:Uma2 family endonuclease
MGSAVEVLPITIEQYLSFESPEGYRDELINGRIIVSPEPKLPHFDVAANVCLLLRSAVGAKYKVGQRINLRFPNSNSMPSPDIFVMGRDHWKETKAINGYPDGCQAQLIVEVVSPGNRRKALKEKVDIYTQNSIEVWLVYPKRKEVKVYRRDAETVLFSEQDGSSIQLPKPLKGAVAVKDIFLDD